MVFNLRRRRKMRQVVVQSIEQVTPRVRRIVFGGEDLAGFSVSRPGSHIKLVFDDELGKDARSKQSGWQMRTYTPRFFNSQTNELTVEFVLHGSGLASTWAAQAQLGEILTVAGPGGGMDIPDSLKAMVMLIDESAIPAAGTVLEALPAGCTPIVVCEVEDAREQRSLSPSVEVEPIWLLRQAQAAAPGELLKDYLPHLLTSVNDYDAPFWWVACESNAMREIRAHLLNQQGVNKKQLVSRGYWKLGTSNHPDHDYGKS